MLVTNGGSHGAKVTRNTAKNEKIPEGYELVPPDGNYAWVVAFASSFAALVSTTFLPIFSILFSDIISIYQTNTATASWIVSLAMAVGNLLGPVATVIINSYGVRNATIIGGLFLTLGMLTSFFADSIEMLCITYGIIGGFGNNLCFICYPIVLSQYFKKYYGIAIGLLTSSYATGRLAITPLTQYLQSEYGCRGVFLIMAAFMLHVCVAAFLFEPIKRHLILVPIDVSSRKLIDEECRANDAEEHNHNENNGTSVTSLNGDDKTQKELVPGNLIAAGGCSNRFGSVSSICVVDAMTTDDTKDGVRGNDCLCMSWFRKEICGKIDFTLLREPHFYIVCGSSYLHISLMVFTNFFLYPLGLEKGYSAIQLASAMSSKAILEIVSRVVGPSFATYFNISVRHFYISLGFIHGIILLMVVFVNSYSLLIVWILASGLIFGAKTSLNTVLIVKTMGTQRLSSVLGLSAFIQGFFMLFMAPLLGWAHDVTGSFVNIYLILAILQFVLIILWIIKPYLPSK